MSVAVENWLSKFAPSTAETYRFHFDRWMGWMAENGGGLAGLSPEELVEYQMNTDNGNRYVILDLIQRHVREIPGRYHYKMKIYTSIRSFFMHSRAPLPPDRSFRPRAEKPPVRGTLTIEEIKKVIMACKPVYQAVYMCILQGAMDERGVVDWNEAGYDAMMRDLPEVRAMRRDDRFLRIRLPGRKKYRNIKPFYTYVGGDAVDALENWLKRRPRDAEVIFTNQYGEPITEESMRLMWTSKLKKLGIVEPGKPDNTGNRYGKNLHEVRDVFRSMWEKSPAKGSVAEFMMGHQIDPLEYNKACRDEDWTLREYRKAVPYLQIMSSGIPFDQVSIAELEKLKNEEIADMQRRLDEQELMMKEMVLIWKTNIDLRAWSIMLDALADGIIKESTNRRELYHALLEADVLKHTKIDYDEVMKWIEDWVKRHDSA